MKKVKAKSGSCKRPAPAGAGESHPAVGAKATDKVSAKATKVAFEALRLAYIGLLDAGTFAEEMKQPKFMRYYDWKAEKCRKALLGIGVIVRGSRLYGI